MVKFNERMLKMMKGQSNIKVHVNLLLLNEYFVSGFYLYQDSDPVYLSKISQSEKTEDQVRYKTIQFYLTVKNSGICLYDIADKPEGIRWLDELYSVHQKLWGWESYHG